MSDLIRYGVIGTGMMGFEHLAFQRAIREDRAPEVSVRDGLLAVALGLAAERSAEEHRPVELTELGL
jgi:predicted dehydrogenase